jgi:hypothetical protein
METPTASQSSSSPAEYQRVFDSAQAIEITVFRADGDKKVTVKHLNDGQIERRNRATKILVRRVRGGATEHEVLRNREVDLAIFEEIKVSGDELEAFEASYVLERLIDTELIDAVREGGCYRVSMDAVGCMTEHLLNIPTQKQVANYRDHSRKAVHRQRLMELKVYLEIGRTLYDALLVEKTGYAKGSLVPISHKNRVVDALMDTLADDQRKDVEEDPN